MIRAWVFKWGECCINDRIKQTWRNKKLEKVAIIRIEGYRYDKKSLQITYIRIWLLFFCKIFVAFGKDHTSAAFLFSLCVGIFLMLKELESTVVYGTCDMGTASTKNIEGECYNGKGSLILKSLLFWDDKNQGTGEQLAYPKPDTRAASSVEPQNLTSSLPEYCLLPAFPSTLPSFSSGTNYKGITFPRPN